MALMQSNLRRMAHIPQPAPEDMVRNGLALTPSQIYELQKQGLPVSNQTAGIAFDDGSYKCDWHVLSEYRRGVEITDLFEEEQNTRRKAKSVFSKLESSQQKEEK